MSKLDKPAAQMRSEKAGAAGDEKSGHGISVFAAGPLLFSTGLRFANRQTSRRRSDCRGARDRVSTGRVGRRNGSLAPTAIEIDKPSCETLARWCRRGFGEARRIC
ncbi:hypothetical protein MesoLj131a_49920 [Mesorhizobium sp. 131-2-1]|nr:hypothetical protein MesoLj131a_49920 [Mesorhizobium sp. 131-2-1]